MIKSALRLKLYPKGPGKNSLVAQHMKLRDAGEVERYRGLWKTAFTALASAISNQS